MIFFICFSLIVDAILVYYLIACAKDLAYLDKLLEKYEDKERYIESTCVVIGSKRMYELEYCARNEFAEAQAALFYGGLLKNKEDIEG